MADVTDPPSLRERIAKVIYDHTRDSSAYLPERCDEAADAIIALLGVGELHRLRPTDEHGLRPHPTPGPRAYESLTCVKDNEGHWYHYARPGADTCVCGARRRPPGYTEDTELESPDLWRRPTASELIPIIADATVPPHEARIRTHANPQAACTRTIDCASGSWSGDHLARCPVGDNAAAVERALLPHAPCPDMAHPHTPHAYVQPPETRTGGHPGYRRAWCQGTQGTLHPSREASDPTPGGGPQAQPEAAGRSFPGLALECSVCGATTPKDAETAHHFPFCSALPRTVTTYPTGLGKDGVLSAPSRIWWCITCGQAKTEPGMSPRPEDRCAVCSTTSCHTGGDAMLRAAKNRRAWNEKHPDNRATALAPGGRGTVDLSHTTTTPEDA